MSVAWRSNPPPGSLTTANNNSNNVSYLYQQNQTQRAIPQPTIMYNILSTLLAPTARGFSSTCTHPLHDYGNRSGRTR